MEDGLDGSTDRRPNSPANGVPLFFKFSAVFSQRRPLIKENYRQLIRPVARPFFERDTSRGVPGIFLQHYYSAAVSKCKNVAHDTWSQSTLSRPVNAFPGINADSFASRAFLRFAGFPRARLAQPKEKFPRLVPTKRPIKHAIPSRRQLR